jgi:hypothetical protein
VNAFKSLLKDTFTLKKNNITQKTEMKHIEELEQIMEIPLETDERETATTEIAMRRRWL